MTKFSKTCQISIAIERAEDYFNDTNNFVRKLLNIFEQLDAYPIKKMTSQKILASFFKNGLFRQFFEIFGHLKGQKMTL